MNADGFVLMDRLKREPELAIEINRCAYYARQKQKVNEIYLASLFAVPNMNAETITIRLLAEILDELT